MYGDGIRGNDLVRLVSTIVNVHGVSGAFRNAKGPLYQGSQSKFFATRGGGLTVPVGII